MLKAGAGKAAIHFPESLFPLEGFCGIHDEPHAGILLLEAGKKVVIGVLELVMLPESVLNSLKALIATITGVQPENIWLHVTHAITTPHAPGGPAIGPGGRTAVQKPMPSQEQRAQKLETLPPETLPPETVDGSACGREAEQFRLYENAIQTAVCLAARQAVESFVEAYAGIGQGDCDINANRDVQTPYGWWIGLGGKGLSNKQLSIIKFESVEKTPIAYIMSYGIKPCAIDNSQMAENKRRISSDVPGRACHLMEQQLHAPVLFLMSAAGDQIPKRQAWYDELLPDGTVKTVDLGVDAGLEIVEALGKDLAQAAMKVSRQIECHVVDSPVQVLKTSFDWPGQGRVELKPRKAFEYTADGTVKSVPVEAMVLEPLALVGTKPEVNCITELELKKASPFNYTFLVTMVNGGMKYMPDQYSFDQITWEATNSMLMPGAAEAFVEAAGQLLRQGLKNCEGELAGANSDDSMDNEGGR